MGEQVIPDRGQKSADLFIASIFYILLFSLFLLPPLPIREGWPNVQVTEMLLPFLIIGILTCPGWTKNWKILKPVLMILSIYALIILLSMLANGRMGMPRDHFEIFKLIKFSIVLLFSFFFLGRINFTKALKWIFILVLLFNFLHYIDFMGFNKHIQVYYGNEIHILGFGVNSLGEPATKRILGTLGNPNNNAILFLFFTIFFFPEKGARWKQKIFFYLAVLGVFACQSRTGFIAFASVYLLALFLSTQDLKATGIDLAVFVCMYFFLFFMGNIYLSTIAGNVMKQGSVQSRMKTWEMLYGMIRQKPILGWSPYKEFISGKIYPEGEYIFVTWKYGITGLLVHMSWLLYTLYISWKARLTRPGRNLLMFTLVILITSITNTPINDQTIFIIFAILTGAYYHSITTAKS